MKGKVPSNSNPPGHQTTPPNHYLNVEPSLFSSCFFRQRSNGLEYSRRSQIFSFQNLDLESLLTKLNSTDLSLFQHQLSGKKVQLLLSSSKVLCARCMFYPNWNERSHFVDSLTICLSKVDWRNSGYTLFFRARRVNLVLSWSSRKRLRWMMVGVFTSSADVPRVHKTGFTTSNNEALLDIHCPLYGHMMPPRS